MSSAFEKGLMGERIAAAFLESNGYRVLEKRYRFERAEVDLVCFELPRGESPGQIVFVEVKARSSSRFGAPEDAVTTYKQKSIIKAASAYLYESKMERAPCRFDVVSIDVSGAEPKISHFKNAFDATSVVID